MALELLGKMPSWACQLWMAPTYSAMELAPISTEAAMEVMAVLPYQTALAAACLAPGALQFRAAALPPR